TSTNVAALATEHGVIIEKNATLTLPIQSLLTPSGTALRTGRNPDAHSGRAAGQSELRVHSNWINRGMFLPGNSKVTLLDDEAAINGPTTFFDLHIGGKNTRLASNARITNTLAVHGSLVPNFDDTVFVDNSSTLAIADTGRITRSTITRRI